MKKHFVFVSLVFLSMFLVFSARAAEIIKPDPANPNTIIGAGETHKNLYAAGGNISVNGNTLGDLVLAGGMVNLVGNVEQDLLLAGGTLNLSGQIGGDARVAGGNVSISSPIGGDLVLGGGNVEINSKSSIGGDVLLAGGNIILDAPVKGSVKIAGGNIIINSKIGGDVQVRANQNLSFGPQAEVAGKISYKGPKPATVAEGAKVGAIDYTPYNPRGFGNGLKALLTAAFLIKLLAWMVVGFLFIKFKKKFVMAISYGVQSKPWQNLGFGLLGFIGAPILVILLFVTVIGYYLAFLLGAVFALGLLLTNVLASLVLGYWVLKYLSKSTDKYLDWEAVILGVVLWAVLGLIPFLGWVIMAVIFLFTFGSLLQNSKQTLFPEEN